MTHEKAISACMFANTMVTCMPFETGHYEVKTHEDNYFVTSERTSIEDKEMYLIADLCKLIGARYYTICDPASDDKFTIIIH